MQPRRAGRLQQRKLESAKARALQEAGDIMGRLADIIPKLDSGFTPKDLLDEEYLGGKPLEEDRAAEMVANMNQLLQQEIDRLSDENAQIDEQLAAAGADRREDTLEDMPAAAHETEGLFGSDSSQEGGYGIEALEALEDEQQENPLAEDAKLPEIDVAAVLSKELFGQEEQTVREPDSGAAVDMEERLFAVAKEDVRETVRLSAETKRLKTFGRPREETVPQVELPEDEKTRVIQKLSKEQRELFTYFLPISGMEQQICQALTGAAARLRAGGGASTGNMIIQGGQGSGKTVLATSMIKALQKETGKPNGRIGKIEASVLNQKNVRALLQKVAGGCLIIEKAGGLSKETAQQLGVLLGADQSGVFVIVEDTGKGIRKALSKDAGFATRFSEKINIPIFTSDELVAFGKSYAHDLGYTIDEMGVLALYNCISNIQKLDEATTLSEVKEIVDTAVARAERGGLKKAFSIIASHRYDEDDYVILREKDFEF